MKLLIASDIHGNLENTKRLLEKFTTSKADYLIILGDIYHGYSYEDSREMMNLFSHICQKLYLLRGNCDSDYDNEMSPVGLLKELKMKIGNRMIYFNHGHTGFPNAQFNPGDIYCHGHTHISEITNYHDIIVCNPGSISLPRGGTKASYMIIDEKQIILYDFCDNIIKVYDLR